MNNPTSNDNRPRVADSAAPTSAPLAANAQTDLEAQVFSRRAELIAKLVALKGTLGQEAAEARSLLRAKLSHLAHIIKQGVVDGWASIGEAAKVQLDRWLAESRKA